MIVHLAFTPVTPVDPGPLVLLLGGGALFSFVVTLGVMALGLWLSFLWMRFVIFSAMKQHTRWVQAGQPNRMPRRRRW